MPQVALLVLDDSEINAYATKFDNSYAIMLNSALFDAIHRFFRNILAHPSTFLSIGNFAIETVPTAKNSLTFDQFVADIPKYANRIPQDQTRSEFADHLTELTMRFVIEHELAHIITGHLDFDPKLTKILEIANNSNLTEEENFGIEMHADEIAFFSCLHWIFDSVNGTERIHSKQIFIETLDAQIHDLYTATYSLFQIFSHLSVSTTHPNPLHRQIRLGIILDWYCNESKIQLINKPYELVAQVIGYFNEYMESVFGIDWSDRQQEEKYILCNAMNDEIKPYSEMVTAMYPALKPHAYVDLE